MTIRCLCRLHRFSSKKLISEKAPGTDEILYPEKKNKLLKLISSLDETDNPILMVVTLKQR
jgi:hypothetical protein